jgi:ERF superfamily
MTAPVVSVPGAEPEIAFATALAAFQGEMPRVAKEQTANAGNYSYSYADLTVISEAALPVLSKHGLSFTAVPTVTEHGFVLRYSLLHIGGHRESGDFPLPDPAKFGAQQIGSWLTYARRYALCAVTGIAPGGDDDDAQKAGDARAADVTRAPRRAQRRSSGDYDPSTVADDFATPVTDAAWMEGFRTRLIACTKPSEVRGLETEARVQYAEGHLTGEDAKLLKGEIDMRMQELTESQP